MSMGSGVTVGGGVALLASDVLLCPLNRGFSSDALLSSTIAAWLPIVGRIVGMVRFLPGVVRGGIPELTGGMKV